MQHFIGRFTLFLSFYFLAVSVVFATPGINMPVGVTPVSNEIYQLHMAGFYICCAIGAVVFGVLLYSLIKYRKSKGAQAANFHEHLGIEILWTTIPFLILVALAIPATIVLKHIHNTEESELTVKVTGFQWKWRYEYLDQGISFFSILATTQDQINNKVPKNPWFLLEVDKPLVVPVDTKVKLLITADDVIHSWWVPELGIKQDGIPGYINENWVKITKPGTYRGQCAELCGINHGFMPIVVKAVPKAEFAAWVNANRASMQIANQQKSNVATLSEAELMSTGRVEYERSCGMCHQNGGEGLLPSFPALRKSRIVTGSVAANIAFVLTGVPGTAMQAFGDQLDDKTLAAIITYTRNSWGNDGLNRKHNNPVIVQPQDIAKARQSKK